MQARSSKHSKIGLLSITVALAALVWLLGGTVLWFMLKQQARIEKDAQHIHDVSSAMVFEATHVIRTLEWLAREGDAIVWIDDAAERESRRKRLHRLLEDATLQGDSGMRELVTGGFAVLDKNLHRLTSDGSSQRRLASEEWKPVMQAILDRAEAERAQVADLATQEADRILESTADARELLMLVAAALGITSIGLFGLLYFALTRPVARLARSLLLARDGHPIVSSEEAIRELQMLHDAAVALADAHVKLESARGQLEQMAHTDALTGLANRRMFDLYGGQAFVNAQRYGDPISIIEFDVDHFKQINDKYSHEGGDIVLRELGSHLLKAVRGADFPAARTGGEEFALLLPKTALDEAVKVAQRLCGEISELEVTMPSGEAIRFTVSLGVTQLHQDDADLKALMHRADLALYQAKQKGRNRVEFAV